jgi:PAS domain S-box-containing protein
VEETLRRSEERFRALIENAFDGITIVGADGRVLYQSPALDRILGYKPEERVGSGVLDLIHPEDLPAVKETFSRFVKNPDEVVTMSLRFKHKDGSWRWMECRSNNLLQDPAVGGMVTNYRDITEHRQVDEALRESEQRYRAIVENSSEVIFSIDTQGRIAYISHAIERLGGYTLDEVIGTNFACYVVPEDLPGLMASMERTLSGQREPYEFRVLCKDGTTRTVISSSNALLQNGQPVGLTGVLCDVTERQWLEDVLRFSEHKYRQLVETLNEGIWQIDKDACTTYVNPRMAKLLGYDTGEMIGKHLFEFMDEQAIDIAKSYLKRRKRGVAEQHEFEFIRKDGKRISAMLAASPIFDEDGKYNGAIASVQAITERRKAEYELRVKDSAIASSINALTLTDLNGIITYVNNSFLKLWGYDDATGVLDKHITEMWKREKQAVSIMEAVLSRGGSSGELEAVRKDGSSFIAQISSNLVTDEAGAPICTLWSCIDITERRRAEESLRKERDRAQSYLDITEVMMVVVDADEKVSLINKKGCEVLGYKTKEVIDKNWFDCFIPERNRERIRDLFKKVISGEVELAEYYESRVVTASGEERTIAWHSSVLVSEDGKVAGTLGSGVDITERKQAEDERGKLLQQLYERVKELGCLYGISNVLAQQNISTEKIFSEIVVLIPQAWRYPEVACARIHVEDKDFTTKNFRETEWKLSQDIAANGARVGCVEVYYLEQRPEVTEGPFTKEERYLIDAVAKRLGEAIERKEAKQALRESEEKLRLMFETVQDGIIVSDVEGRITEANKSAVRMHGFTRKEELVGRCGFDFIAEKDRARAGEDMKKALESGKVLDMVTYTFVDSRGKEFQIEYRTSVLSGPGRVLWFLCVMRDITGRKRK